MRLVDLPGGVWEAALPVGNAEFMPLRRAFRKLLGAVVAVVVVVDKPELAAGRYSTDLARVKLLIEDLRRAGRRHVSVVVVATRDDLCPEIDADQLIARNSQLLEIREAWPIRLVLASAYGAPPGADGRVPTPLRPYGEDRIQRHALQPILPLWLLAPRQAGRRFVSAAARGLVLGVLAGAGIIGLRAWQDRRDLDAARLALCAGRTQLAAAHLARAHRTVVYTERRDRLVRAIRHAARLEQAATGARWDALFARLARPPAGVADLVEPAGRAALAVARRGLEAALRQALGRADAGAALAADARLARLARLAGGSASRTAHHDIWLSEVLRHFRDGRTQAVVRLIEPFEPALAPPRRVVACRLLAYAHLIELDPARAREHLAHVAPEVTDHGRRAQALAREVATQMVPAGGGGFYIDFRPVSNADYHRFLVAARYTPAADDPYRSYHAAHWRAAGPPAGVGRHPMRHLSRADAAALARWWGMQLPARKDWPALALGLDGRNGILSWFAAEPGRPPALGAPSRLVVTEPSAHVRLATYGVRRVISVAQLRTILVNAVTPLATKENR